MEHNNAAEVNVECEKTIATSLLDLNDFALLKVFGYLNLRDCINFAGTSKRLKSVGALHFTKYKRLNLAKYELSVQPEKLPAETILSHIGQHITTLSIDSSMPSTVDNCVNVKTLKIYDCDDTSELKKWMQQLKLESLTIGHCKDFNDMSVRLEALKELHLTNDNVGLTSMQLTNILEKTAGLETLELSLRYYPDFNFDIFTKFLKLQCLDITIYSEDLVKLTEFLKMDVITRFKVRLPFNYDAERLPRLNSFLEILAERSKLNELQFYTDTVDQNTFRILKSFHDVSSLGFYADNYGDDTRDERWMVHQLLVARPNLKRLDFLGKNLRIEHVDFVVKNLVKLETFTFDMQTKDLEELNEFRINEILKTSTSRPMLTLYINSRYSNAVKIELRFEQRKHRLVKLGRNYADDSYFLTDDFSG